jgi:hypothetical protein
MKPNHDKQTIYQLKQSIDNYHRLMKRYSMEGDLQRAKFYKWKIDDAQRWLDFRMKEKPETKLNDIKKMFNDLIAQGYDKSKFDAFAKQLRKFIQNKKE